MKKISIVLCIIMVSLIMEGCFSYRDINKVLFVTSVVVDIDEKDNNVILYTEAFKPVRGSKTGTESDVRLIYRGIGKTLFEAVRDISLGASYRLNYSQNKAIIFSEKAAEYGLDNFVDFFDRDQEFIIRPYICIYIGDVEKLLKSDFKEEKYMGIFITRMIENVGASSRAVRLSLHEFYNQRLIGDKTNVITTITIRRNPFGEHIEVSGGAIVKQDKMIGIIGKREGQGFNFLIDNVQSGTLEITNPDDERKFVTLEILKSKTKTEINYDGENINLTKNIKVKTSLAEVQKKLIQDEEALNKIKIRAENNVQKYSMDLFDKYKEEGIDIFDIKEELYRKYPQIEVENVMKITKLSINVQVEILSSNDTKDFL